MPDLRPFRGLRYNPALVPDLSSVLCPPYDVISPAQRASLLARDERNAVRLELPSDTPASATPDDFSAAAAQLRAWLADGTLVRDERPMISVYEQRFVAGDGTPHVARSFSCELRVEPYGPTGAVRPHEHTLGPAREHRFQLLSAVRAHLSPVVLLYESDAARSLLEQLISSADPASMRAAHGPLGVEERIWAVDPAASPAARELLASAAQHSLTIADGHHRYETALRYRDTPGAPAGASHVMVLLYEAHTGGLELEPWQRVISAVPDADAVPGRAARIFSAQRATSAEALLATVSNAKQAGTLGIWTRSGGWLLVVDLTSVAPFVASLSSEALRWLDVSVLSGTLSPMIGSTESELAAAGRLSYTHDARVAVAAVDEGAADVCFLLRPTPVDQVLAVAAAGEFMPAKSTYFHPKAATGLVFDPLS